MHHELKHSSFRGLLDFQTPATGEHSAARANCMS